MSDRLRRIIAWWQIVCAALGLAVFAVAYLNWMPGGRVWLLQTLGPINTLGGSAFFSFAIAAGRALLRKEPWSVQACMVCQAVQVVFFAFLHGPQVQIAAGPFLGFTIASGSFKFSAGFYASFFLGTRLAGPAYEVSVNVIAAVWTAILFREAYGKRAPVLPAESV